MMRLGFDALILTTVGAKSGAERTNPVGCFPGKDGSWLIVASVAGPARNPAWYHNIAAHPERGRAFDAQLAELRAVLGAAAPRLRWVNRVGPSTTLRPGPGDRRWCRRGLPPHDRIRRRLDRGRRRPASVIEGADKAGRAWREAGRAGRSRLAALAYVSLGDNAETHAQHYLRDYYSFTGDFAERIAAGALTSPQKVAGMVTPGHGAPARQRRLPQDPRRDAEQRPALGR